jgi:protein ImuB
LVLVANERGASRLATVDRRARALGLQPGMTLSDARSRVPELHAIAGQPAADRAFLEQLADLALAFTPSVALDLPDGLALDITGCAHLFSGEAGLAARLQDTLRTAGVTAANLAVAFTPDMARALARFSGASPCFADTDAQVRALPVEALECDHEDGVALKRAGLRTIADIADRPTALFTARFTTAFSEKVARVLGEEDRRITPLRKPPPCRSEHRCVEPVVSYDVIARIVMGLAQDVGEQLRLRGEGGRAFVATFMHTDGLVRWIGVETSLPTRDAAVIMRLYRDRFEALADPLDPGFGFDLIRFEACRTEACVETQATLDAHDESSDKLAHLIDRLGAMFGCERVKRLHPADSHIPERAQVAASALTRMISEPWAQCRPASGVGLRPPLMFARPQPIDVEADDDQVPVGFCWRRVAHSIAHVAGPERIAEEWWRPPSGYGTRDYYRVEDARGSGFWIFRAEATAARERQSWFLHGLFP